MSLLGAQVFANPSTPCWLSSAGGAIAGNISANQVFARKFNAVDTAGVTHGDMTLNTATTGLMLAGDSNITFGKTGTTAGNTVLTVSTAGTNLDSLAVGGALTTTGAISGLSAAITSNVGCATLAATGAISGLSATITSNVGCATLTATGAINGIGPVPVSLTTAGGLATVVAPNTSVTLAVSPSFVAPAGGIFDVDISGFWSTDAGTTTPAAGDRVLIEILLGGGALPGSYLGRLESVLYPAAERVWTASTDFPFRARGRVVNNTVSPTTLTGIDATFTSSGTYPTVSVTVQTLSIVRVE